jgi:hypothetical protein
MKLLKRANRPPASDEAAAAQRLEAITSRGKVETAFYDFGQTSTARN